MAKDGRRKLSDIMRELVEAVLRDPRAERTPAAVEAALLLAHVAWNRALGRPAEEVQYRPMLADLERTDPGFWDELADNDAERLIERLMALKQARYPQDDRVIQLAVLSAGHVHVEWYEGEDIRECDRIATGHLARMLELILAGDQAEAVRHTCRTTGMSPDEAWQWIRLVYKTLPVHISADVAERHRAEGASRSKKDSGQ
jgi:hypothetical protein